MKRQFVLGMGAGHCGLNLLADILSRQPAAHVTLEQPPRLPWKRRPGAPGIRERLARWRRHPPERELVGDVAAFYLPYVDEAIACEPSIRIVCLQRPREEIVDRFLQHLDRHTARRVNHWSRTPEAGWEHDPLWSATFPQYDDAPDRRDGVTRYCDEYYRRASELAGRYPEQVRIIDTDELTTSAGVEALLDFLGIRPERRVVVTGQRPRPEKKVPAEAPAPEAMNPDDPRRCVVLVPFSGYIHQECDDALKELERRGYPVRRVGGYAAIDQGRNQMATDALLEGFAETLWIDSDVGFHPDHVERLRAHNLPICSAIYPQKGKRAIASHVLPGTKAISFGKEGGLRELLYAAAGFLHVRREVYLAIQRECRLPMCNERFGQPMIPFFQPLVRTIDDGYWYLAEDYSFCERARQCGFKIHADTTLRLWHIGMYRYGWEDAGMERRRFNSFTMRLAESQDVQKRSETNADNPPTPDRT